MIISMLGIQVTPPVCGLSGQSLRYERDSVGLVSSVHRSYQNLRQCLHRKYHLRSPESKRPKNQLGLSSDEI